MDADRAAYQILDAVRNRRPEFTITFAARLAAIAQTLLPNVTADLMKLTARLFLECQFKTKKGPTLVGKANRFSLLLCSRELQIVQRSYTMASGIILRHGKPAKSSFGPSSPEFSRLTRISGRRGFGRVNCRQESFTMQLRGLKGVKYRQNCRKWHR